MFALRIVANFTRATLDALICLTQMLNPARTRKTALYIYVINANSVLIGNAYVNCRCKVRIKVTKHTFAFISVSGSSSSPRSVEVEGLASLAIAASGVVLAVARQLCHAGARWSFLGWLHWDASRRVPVALAPTAHREIGHGIVLRTSSRLLLAIQLIPLVYHVQPIKHHPHIGSRHPILQNRRHIETSRTGTTLESAKREPSTTRTIPS